MALVVHHCRHLGSVQLLSECLHGRPCHTVIDDADHSSVLRNPSVAATIWRRQVRSDFQTWIDSLEPEKLPSVRVILEVAAVREAIEITCDNVRLPRDAHRRFLVDDIVVLTRHFADLMDCQFVRVRLEVVRDDACRKFHIDSLTARLVCTYRGPGTQYGISTDGNEPSRVFSVPTGAPILLRGTKWPDPPVSGLMHRSPPVEGTGITRLVLVVDPVIGPT